MTGKENTMEYQTRQWLEEALFDLLATKKSLQNISIAELSEHAQIARRRFIVITIQKRKFLRTI